MPSYNYKVKTEAGKVLTGEVKIESEHELRRILEEKGYKVVDIVEKLRLQTLAKSNYSKRGLK